ncbi:SDR family NAD(P)-dependent oxidoreductase [Geobacter sp. DSM 9736]|uniref:SDR family NAD(P)-dependent oxidoreductase n=1 Tax=Geobacter sp. DSM 9736 TaxID=1277350 RepID=UPI000B505298|nr:SDR family NAD(P)-dependent oxidoreductase [Geobacter sp. DSM 9736]SNB46859.1 Short-chain dehydrogenase [Geobacter sp. DSM 9736]
MKNSIIVGASSGIGRELAHALAAKGHTVGLASRRTDALEALQKEIPRKTYVRQIDLAEPEKAMDSLRELITEMGGMELVVISSGISFHNPDLMWESELDTINVNVVGFTAMATAAFRYFCEKGGGHIVGISSFRALRGGWSSPAYNASKAYVSNYLEGLRIKAKKLGKDIRISDIRPGLVATPMIGKKEGMLVASAKKAADQIAEAIEKKEPVAYVTKRYRLIAALMRNMPDSVYSRL